jgi:CSLREA domain-containing protein
MKTKIRFITSILVISALFVLPVKAQTKNAQISEESITTGVLSEPADFLASPETSVLQANIIVNTTIDMNEDPSFCSLREAVLAANTNTAQGGCPAGSPGTDMITFALSGTIVLSAGQFQVSSSGGAIVIDGSGETVKISAGNTSRVFYVDPGASLSLVNLSIINGNATDGGAVYNNSYLWVENSILSGNQALTGSGRGGAIYNSGTTVLANSTISANQAISGGGIYNASSLYIASGTLANNNASSSGGGIYSQGYGFSLSNTILAKNNATNGADCYGNIVTSYQYNLVGIWNGCSIYPTTGDLIGVDPLTGPLADNGGPTFTHALLPGSLAIDHGNPSGCQDSGGIFLTTDQRGSPRSGRCDIGAFEFQHDVPVGPYTLYLPYVMRGCTSILFFDDFSVHNYGWKIGDYSGGLYEYLDGEYRILAKTAPAWESSRSGFEYADYMLEVDVRNATGIYGYGGFVFESAEDWSEFFAFQVDTNGNYVIFRFPGGWLSNGYSPSIHRGTASNHLKLERNGSLIWAYANGELLTIIPEATSTEPRYVGLMTIADPISNVDARYDNFTVKSISCGASSTYPIIPMLAMDDLAGELVPPESWELMPQPFGIGK